tara:strand:- start:200 stop:481 length:282 start_codon:yes stop_codon:yes gene_type:complete
VEDKDKLIDDLYDRDFLEDSEEIILSDGFEEALLGISVGKNKIAVYSFWKALDCLMRSNNELSFDEAYDWLDSFSQEKIKHVEELTPIFIKTI